MITLSLPWILVLALSLLVLVLLLVARRKKPSSPEREGLAYSRILAQLEGLDRMAARTDQRLEGLDRAFRTPRMRGGFGETLLEEMLGAWLPKGSWSAQFVFPDGRRTDAVIRMGSRIVAVDAKFPLERISDWLEDAEGSLTGEARRTFLSHAKDIADRYIRPADGTLNFALMYLPAEALHYRLVRDDDGSLMRECLRMGVLPTGPAGLFAYLQTVAYGLRGMALPEEGAELRRRVDRLRRDFAALAKPFATASTHLRNLSKSWDEMDRLMVRAERSLEDLDTGGR